MTEFVTVDQVDNLLGLGWEGDGDDSRAVMEANAYLSALAFRPWTTQPEAVTQAGAELARMAATKALFVDSDATVRRKRVKAGEVETETEYAEGSVATHGTMQLVHALLKPYLLNTGSVKLIKRL